MSNPLDSVLGRALAIRLNLQISLSSLPVVEEWMDIHFNRWLESVPMPPEMPRDHTAHFAVTLASDLSQVSWRAYGAPAGFIPKMADYLNASNMSKDDLALIDQLGNGLEPALVGTWIAAQGGNVVTGWQFCDEHPFASYEPHLGEHDAKRALVAWLAGSGVERVRRFSQSIGEETYSEIEFAIPGDDVATQLEVTAAALSGLWPGGLPAYATSVLSTALAPGFSVAVRIRGGQIESVAALASGVGNDGIAQLCREAGVAFDKAHVTLQGVLGADGPDRVEFRRGSAGDEVHIHVIPTDVRRPPTKEVN